MKTQGELGYKVCRGFMERKSSVFCIVALDSPRLCAFFKHTESSIETAAENTKILLLLHWERNASVSQKVLLMS